MEKVKNDERRQINRFNRRGFGNTVHLGCPALVNSIMSRPDTRARGVIMEKIKLSRRIAIGDRARYVIEEDHIKNLGDPLYVYPAAEVDAEIEEQLLSITALRAEIDEYQKTVAGLQADLERLEDLRCSEINAWLEWEKKHKAVVEAARKAVEHLWTIRTNDESCESELRGIIYTARDIITVALESLDAALRELDGCAGGKGE